MANPRKFSEKIALHNQKQAEETAAFEEIMREVMGATRNRTLSNVSQYDGSHQQQQLAQQNQQHLNITPLFNATRAGSLPNVNQIGQTAATTNAIIPNAIPHQTSPTTPVNQNSSISPTSTSISTATTKGIDLRSALNNLQEIKDNVRSDGGTSCRRSVSANRSPYRHHSSHNISSMANNYNDIGSHVNHHFNSITSCKRSQSPYSMNSNAYLSPPTNENQWRRTNSDSALHQSSTLMTMGGMSPTTGQQMSPQQQMSPHQQMSPQQQMSPNDIFTNNSSSPQDSCNNSPGQTPSMIIDDTTGTTTTTTTGDLIFDNQQQLND